ncbi:hypothetical protein SLE2022_295730 [Rubroshorea leprosula]|uniref:TF-B3 domain-containing protein n=1 Tax=Rubroshorea leprosula TaxID=152421 RepID=A0AAV5KGD0_9ROSI|nr:hypothetical protein SLEP1_g33367 [Rubroshorea leprosula]
MPSFSKFLSDSDVKKQMAIDSNFVQHLPQSRRGATVHFPVVDISSGTLWNFGYYVRMKGHLKPAFQGGWHNYRRHKGLKVGDKIIFWADRGRYRIKALRKIKLFGQEMYGVLT